MKLKTLPNRLKTQPNRLSNGHQVGQVVRVKGSKWKRIRLEHLAEEPLCRMCRFQEHVTLANEVDHIKPLWEGGEEYDRNNLQSLCTPCHIIKTSEEAKRRSKQFNGV